VTENEKKFYFQAAQNAEQLLFVSAHILFSYINKIEVTINNTKFT
jgi:hypothetical protein